VETLVIAEANAACLLSNPMLLIELVPAEIGSFLFLYLPAHQPSAPILKCYLVSLMGYRRQESKDASLYQHA
jgi:hypothetical protein